MIPEGGRSAPEPGRDRPILEHLAFLLLAVLIVVLPGWIRSTPRGDLSLREAATPAARIHVNRAAWYEWMLLEGIGEARARNVVRHREAHGPFRSEGDLARIPRMPSGWVERARDRLVFDD